MATDHPSGRALRLLSLDGGGVRGLSSLIILRYLMKLLHPSNPPKPCEYFDLICGTSTGGLIAIMLGRLRMDIDDCITVYQDLAGKVFKPKRSKFNFVGKGKDLWNISGSFDAEKFAQAVKDIVQKSGLLVDAKLHEPSIQSEAPDMSSSQCRVFVCAVRTEINKPVRLRSYTTEASVDEIPCTIWEAARATSAASSFFSHIDIGSQRFTDGATECNNPVEDLLDEANEIWPGALDRVARIVSIGTGKPKLEAFGKNLIEVGKTLVRISTDTERVAERFERFSHDRGLDGAYFRFNVTQGLEDVGLESYDQQGKIWAATNHYLNDYHVKGHCKAFAKESEKEITQAEQKRYFGSLHTYNVIEELQYVTKPFGETFQWVFNNDKFRGWLDQPEPSCLVIRGKPGCGKTVLMAHIRSRLDMNAAFFAFKETDHLRRTPSMLLSSLLNQILQAQPNLFHCMEPLSRLYREWTYEQLLASLRSILFSNTNKGLICFIDGLDECDSVGRRRLIRDLKFILNHASEVQVAPKLKLIVSSRDYPDIVLPGSLLDLDRAQEMNRDLHDFIFHAVHGLTEERPHYGPLADFIINKLEKRANGMYRLVELLIERLNHLTDSTISSLEASLEEVPNTIAEIYDSIWARIPLRDRSKAERIFSWILCSQRPLTISGFAIALSAEFTELDQEIAIDPSQTSIDISGDMRRLFGPLIRVHSSIELSHQSVKDHFLKRDDSPCTTNEGIISSSHADSSIALACLRYLNSLEPRFRRVPDPQANDFIEYALQFTPIHIASGAKYEERFNEEIELLYDHGIWIENWKAVQKSVFEGLPSTSWTPDCTSVVSFACRLNLPRLLGRRLTSPRWPGRYDDCLHRRCIRSSCLWLYEALINHNEECVISILRVMPPTFILPGTLMQLLEICMDPLTDTTINWPKLLDSGNNAFTELRQEHWNKCSWQLSCIQSKIHASQLDARDEAQVSIPYPINENVEFTIRRTYRALFGHTESEMLPELSHSPAQDSLILKFVLFLCVFLNFKTQRNLVLDDQVFTPRSSAVLELVRRGNLRAAEILIQEGAGVLACDSNEASVLHWAARSGNYKLVELVLTQASIDVNATDKKGMTALHYACLRNHLWDVQLFAESRPANVSRANVIQTLLAAGAKADLKDLEGNTPLQILARIYVPDWKAMPRESNLHWRQCDLLECLEILITDIKDVLQWDSNGATIVHYAAYLWPHAAILYMAEYLKSFSVPLTLVDHRGCTPLHYASLRPFDDAAEVIAIFSESGVDVRVRDIMGMDALAVAKKYNKPFALEQLISVKETQAEARKRSLRDLVYQIWLRLDKTGDRDKLSSFQLMLNEICMDNLPITLSPLFAMMRLPHTMQPYWVYPSTEFIHRIQTAMVDILAKENIAIKRQYLIQVPSAQTELLTKFEDATSNILFNLSELERCLDPFAGVQYIPIHRPLIPEQLENWTESTSPDQLNGLAPEPTLDHDESKDSSDSLHTSVLQARLEGLDAKAEEDKMELQKAMSNMMMANKPRSRIIKPRYHSTELSIFTEERNYMSWFDFLMRILLIWLKFYCMFFPWVLMSGKYPLGKPVDLRYVKPWNYLFDQGFLPDSELSRGWMFKAWMRNRLLHGRYYGGSQD